MTFTVLLHPKAARELEKIEDTIKARIVERLRDLKDNPERVGKLLKHSNFWSIRVGDYRVIYEIDRTKKQVIVLFIGHRKKVYDDFSKLF
ncbi:MAG: type II toxin-antitoxin system RelE/ParE family toxin [Candidatus Bathyarchaeota archaeon]|nr:type II toxin-antitoxin system RelE/ParE family toxin [Candidatus Bathyarchaeota archaeon A05DMB-3]MDH7607153.1 type II toxin-antitoxin system RelE/ParE family toxin [Candidatus Bathyarchaeota archaeon]